MRHKSWQWDFPFISRSCQSLSRRGNGQGLRAPDQRPRLLSTRRRRPLPQPLAGGVILQMAQTAPADKEVLGTMENAVRIQICCVIITYCLVAIVQHNMQLERSVYEMLQILSISLTDKTHIVDLFDNSNIGQVKDLTTPGGPSLFDFWPVDF